MLDNITFSWYNFNMVKSNITNFNKKITLPTQRLKDLKVGLIYIFGSHAEGMAGKLSDIDIGVVFSDPNIARGNTLTAYNELYDIFSDIFESQNLDIVLLERAPLELNFDVISRGKIIFEILPDFRFDFEHRINMLYADYKPILNNFDKAVLSRL